MRLGRFSFRFHKSWHLGFLRLESEPKSWRLRFGPLKIKYDHPYRFEADFASMTLNGVTFTDEDTFLRELRKTASFPDNAKVYMHDHPIHGRGLMVEPSPPDPEA